MHCGGSVAFDRREKICIIAKGVKTCSLSSLFSLYTITRPEYIVVQFIKRCPNKRPSHFNESD